MFLSIKVLLILAKSAYPDEMQHYAASSLSLHCLPKYPFPKYEKLRRCCLSLASFYRTSANSAEPDQTPHNAASDQVLHCLLTEVLIKFEYNGKIPPSNP